MRVGVESPALSAGWSSRVAGRPGGEGGKDSPLAPSGAQAPKLWKGTSPAGERREREGASR